MPCVASFVNFRGKVVDSNLALLNQTLQMTAAMVVAQVSWNSANKCADEADDGRNAKCTGKSTKHRGPSAMIKPHP
jgi:hypothetical protein